MKSILANGRMVFCALGLLALAGCYSQHEVYRAVSNVGVSRPNDVGSGGPLVLVTPTTNPSKHPSRQENPASAIDRLTINQIANLDRTMAGDLRELQESRAHLEELRSQFPPKDGVEDDRVRDGEESVRIAERRVETYAADWKELQKKLAIAEQPSYGRTANLNPFDTTALPNAPVKQTVLMISESKHWGDYSSSFGHTVVLIIDEPVKPGQYWLTPDNSVLINYSSMSPPDRTRIGLAGSIKVLSVDNDRIVADVTVQQTYDTDSLDFQQHYYDPKVWQMPWVIKGTHTFIVTKPTDPAFEKAAVHWVTE